MVVGFDFSCYVFMFSFFFGSFSESKGTGLPLSDYIRYFEPLFYDHRHLQEQQRRVTMGHHFPVQFTAHNRFFRLRLKRDTSVFADDTEFYSTKNTVLYDTSRALTGYLEGNEDSSVEAVVTVSGLLDGVIKVGGEEFYIEPAKNYLQTTQHFHSVIYKLSDVDFPKKNVTCLSHRMQPYENDLNSLFDSSKTVKYKDKLKLSKKYESVLSEVEKKMFHKSHPQLKIRHKKSKQSVKLPTVSNIHHHHSANIPKYHYSQRTKPKSFHNVVAAKKFTNTRTSNSGIDVSMPILYETFLLKQKLENHKLFLNRTLNARTKISSSISSSASNNVSTLLTKKLTSSYFQSLSHSVKSNIVFFDFKNSTLYSDSPDMNYDEDSHEDHNRVMSNCSACINIVSPVMATGLPEREGPHSSMKDHANTREDIFQKQELPYWRELDALHYTEEGRTGSSEPYGVRSIQRTQWTEDRGQRHIAVDRRKSTCLLYLQADHLFYQKMGSEEACIEAMTRHVQRVNSIYRSTDFDQDGRPDNISFLIKRIKVHTSPDHSDYRFVGNYGVEKFLELFSEDDYDAFCLAYMFTYRDFEGGTLGLAWTGDLKNAGGVCEKNGHYRGSLKSLNTGIITLLNYGKHVPPVVSHVTLAHEIGHNFGSPHDPEDDQHCTPGDEHGNYIMFARATSGDKKNNNKFSPCSLRSINAVLNTKARSVKGCFTEPLDAVCGNEVVEGAEECDCGWEEDCHEPCCFPMRVNPPQDQPPCRLRPAAFCSPSQGPCCSRDCRLKYGIMCREDNGCRTASFCDGQGPQCPPSTKKPNKTVCSEEFVCYNGECTGSICMAYGLESCQCIRTIHDPLIRSCELCCKLPGDELSCKSSFEWNLAPYDVPDLYAKPGAPCDNYNGYCDVYQSCREIDPSGPLATLRKLLLSPEGAVILRRWLAEKWWGILLLFLAVTLTVVISLRLVSRGHTKNFLSTILPHQRSDFRLCHSRSSTRSHPTYLVTSKSRSVHLSRPRISSAPENGWV